MSAKRFFVESSYRTKTGERVVVRHNGRFTTTHAAARTLQRCSKRVHIPLIEYRRLTDGSLMSPTLSIKVKEVAHVR